MKLTDSMTAALSRRRFLQLGSAAVLMLGAGGCGWMHARRRVPLPISDPPPLFVAEWLPNGLRIERTKLPAEFSPWQCVRLETPDAPGEDRRSVLLFVNEGGVLFAVDGRDRELDRPLYPDRYGSRRILRDAWGEWRFDLVSGEPLGGSKTPALRSWVTRELGPWLLMESP